jgi:hypothetical protein
VSATILPGCGRPGRNKSPKWGSRRNEWWDAPSALGWGATEGKTDGQCLVRYPDRMLARRRSAAACASRSRTPLRLSATRAASASKWLSGRAGRTVVSWRGSREGQGEIEPLFQDCMAVLGLLYQLVAHLIGFKGWLTNFGEPDWPLRPYPIAPAAKAGQELAKEGSPG